MHETHWTKKSGKKQPTIDDVMGPILSFEYDFGTQSRKAAELYLEVRDSAYLAATLAIAKEQPYYSPPMTPGFVTARLLLLQIEATVKLAIENGTITIPSGEKPEDYAKNLREKLTAACTQLAEHYKPGQSHVVGGA